MKNWRNAADSEIICYCKDVSKGSIVSAIVEGNNTLALIRKATSACTGNKCKELNPSGKCCSSDIIELLRLYGGESSSEESCCSCCSG